ncbi:hypothetical protein ABES02_14205 [Neobacillus pocheonensis]|uniref:hypothetical protein n=1 Tax=Neobacillus pocheonensis TaxID=363869 RepID=UPI003D2965D3
MLTASAIVFALAALGGLVLASREERPLSVAIIHGLVAATGLVLLIIAVIQGASGTLPLTALVLFVIAALGGFVLFSFHLRNRPLPKGLIFLHGLLAVIGEVLLIIAIL